MYKRQTLLGTGGLVHAYSKSAKAGVEAAGRLEMILCDELNIECDYSLLGKIQNELHKWETIDGYTDYSDKVKLSDVYKRQFILRPNSAFPSGGTFSASPSAHLSLKSI